MWTTSVQARRIGKDYEPNSRSRWSQDSFSVRWPSATKVALSLAASTQGSNPTLEQDFGTTTTTNIQAHTWWHAPKTHPQPSSLPDTKDTHFPEAETDEDVENHRSDALQYLERKKANLPDIGTRVKTKIRDGANAFKDGIVEGQLGYVLGKFVVEHDLAKIPRLPATALLGVAEDEYHSRDSYVEICNQALDHARRELKKGKRPLILSPSDNDEPCSTNSSIRQTCSAVPTRCKTEGPEAYMDLLDDPPVLPQKRFVSAPAALENQQKVRLAERWQRINKIYASRDDLPEADSPNQYRIALKSTRESEGSKTMSGRSEVEPSVAHHRPTESLSKAQTRRTAEVSRIARPPTPAVTPLLEAQKELPMLPKATDDDGNISHCRRSATKPDHHPTALRPGLPPLNTNSSPAAATSPLLARTPSKGSISKVKQEITRSWESADIQGPDLHEIRKSMVYRQLSVNSREKWEQKKLHRGTKMVGSGEVSQISEAVARIQKTSGMPAENLPYHPMPTEAVERLAKIARKPTDQVKTITLTSQAGSWDAETRAIRRCPGATPLNPKAKTWEDEVKPAYPASAAGPEAPLNPQAKTWESKPLPQIGVPVKRDPLSKQPAAPVPASGVPRAPLNPQAKTWESAPLPPNGVPNKPKPVAQASDTAAQKPKVDVARTLSEFHRQQARQAPAVATDGPIKFGDTHLVDPAAEYTARVRAQKTSRLAPAKYQG